MNILDLWCGTANNKYDIYKSNNDVYGVDIEQENVDTCKEKFPNHTFVKIDWETLPFEDGFFDAIYSLDVLEHVDDLQVVLKEACRVLKKWGKCIIEVPYWASEEYLLKIKPEYWRQVHHVRLFRDGEMESNLKPFWLELVQLRRIKFFENIVLWYFFKKADIINQKWDMNISRNDMWLFRLKYVLFFMIYKIYQDQFDELFPKSVYFEFVKR